MTQTITLNVSGMTCGGCENAVRRALGRLAGVDAVEASHTAERVTVTFDDARVTVAQLRDGITELGYTTR
ncbi:MAG: heavy-metal-associated domain-containing protein [Vicinamibacterales bacterium]